MSLFLIDETVLQDYTSYLVESIVDQIKLVPFMVFHGNFAVKREF